MYESSSHAVRLQVGVLLGGCHGNIPDGAPGMIKVWEDRVGAGVMGGDSVVVGEGRKGVSLVMRWGEGGGWGDGMTNVCVK